MKEAKKALYQNAVIPQLIKVREELNRWLTPKFGDKLYIDFDFSVIPKIMNIITKEKIDIVHTHIWTADLWGRIAAIKKGKK